MVYKALLIGCGNIGAGYDLDTHEVTTHAKAFSMSDRVEFCVSDQVFDRAKTIGERYGVPYYDDLTDDLLAQFDIISICTTTSTHFDYIKRAQKLKVPLIICEKPLVYSLEQIADLESSNQKHTKILVNYIRRFQPGFQVLKERLARILQLESLKKITIKYQRGLLNNGSHAFDLLNFLIPQISFGPITCIAKTYDAFENDPTISGIVLVNEDVPLHLMGFTNIQYSIFEMEIFTGSWKIFISENGNKIEYFCNDSDTLIKKHDMDQKDVLDNYMQHVLNEALKVVQNENESNLATALSVNKYLLMNI